MAEQTTDEKKEYYQVDLEKLGIKPLADIFLEVADDLDKRAIAIFRDWLTQGILGETLALVINRGFAQDEENALLYLNNFVVSACNGDTNISVRKHFNGDARLKRRPAEEETKKEKQEAPPGFAFGTASHNAVLEMMKLPFERVPSGKILRQLDLFPDIVAPAVIPKDTQFVMSLGNGWVRNESVSQNWPTALKRCLDTIRSFSSRDAWYAFNNPASLMTSQLRRILADLFSDLLDKMPSANGNHDLQYLQMLSFMSWGYAAYSLFVDSSPPFEPSCILPEIAVLPYGCGMNAGRIDAFKIVSINGEKPTQEQWNRIASIYFLSEPRPTVGQMILAICQLFGRDVEFEIIDLKCSVGDAVGGNSVIKADEIEKEPIKKHAQQVERYIFFTAVSFHLACMEAGLDVPRDVWKNRPPLYLGWLVYLMHSGPPELHKIRLSARKQKEEFQRRIAFNLHKGMQNSRANTANNALNYHLRAMARWLVRDEETLFPGAHLYIPRPSKNRKVIDIAQQYRQYYDKEELIEVIRHRKDGSPVFMLHLDKLSASEEWQNGDIAGEKFSLPKGGLIRCRNPEHNDSDPSFHLKLSEGRAICYGCGLKTWLMGDITHEGQTMFVFRQTGLGRDSKKKPLTDAHYKIMGQAQLILSASLSESRGVRYLKERGIDMMLARKYGIGYCDDNLIMGLLREGYSIEQLEQWFCWILCKSYRKQLADKPYCKEIWH